MLRLPLVALLALSLVVPTATAQETARPLAAQLTQRGRMLVSGRVMGFWSDDTAQYYAGYNSWSVRADPALTYFLRNHLGLGVALSFGWSKNDMFPTGEYRAHDFALGGEFVWSAAIAPRWRLLLRPFIGYVRQGGSSRNIQVETPSGLQLFGLDSVTHLVRFAGSVPLIYALNENIGIGIAPEYVFDLPVASRATPRLSGLNEGVFVADGSRRTQLGVSLGFYASF